MSLLDKANTNIANMPAVYEAGKQAAYDRFWDTYQMNGTRTDYFQAFSGLGWTTDLFKPKYAMKLYIAQRMFDTNDVSVDLREVCDLDFSTCINAQYFLQNTEITGIGIVDTRSMDSLSYMFFGASRLKVIERLIVKDDGSQNCTYPFFGADDLEEIRFEGVIGKSISFSHSTKLTHDSLISLFDALQDKTGDTSGTTYTVTIGETNKAKLTEEELNIAINKGWGVN